MKSNDEKAQNIYNFFMNSSDTESRFESIIDECSKKHKKYKDMEFYPQRNLIEKDINIFKEHQWRRIEDQYSNNLFENISPESIHPGILIDSYFILSLKYIASHTELVKSLFHPKSSLRYGCVLIYLWYLGAKIPVIIDTQIAYKDSTSSYPLFSHPKNESDSCWFVLIEKAYAKVCGSYSAIVSGTAQFGVHILTDFYSANFFRIEDMIQYKSLEEEEEIKDNSKINDEIFQIISELIKNKILIGTSINKLEKLNEANGLISNHSYSIIDTKESEDKLFIKLRNPWGNGKYRGGYSSKSKKWTEQLKKDLNPDFNDGSFWMLFDKYLYYFNQISYSLPNERNWKEENIYGKIEGYLDGRSPYSDCKTVGCIPQWSIKFSKKTIVRLTYDVAGPESIHGIYICKNQGSKVNTLDFTTERIKSVSNSMVNGIEYNVEDYDEPFTFFFTREEERNDPCYFRIKIQSPDEDFSIEKFDDDFIQGNWNCFSDTRKFISAQNDYWDPNGSLPLTTCRQWYIRFPNLLKKKDSELRFRIFKNENEGPLYLIFARTSDKIDYFNYLTNYKQYIISPKSNYEEISIPISFKNFYKFNDVFEYRENDAADYVFAFYRMKDSNIESFKFSVLCESKFEIGVMPEPDPIHNCGYTIKNKYQSDEESNKHEFTNKWCLIFSDEPTTLFIEFLCNNQSSEIKITLEEKPNPHQMNYGELKNYEFFIRKNCTHDLIMCKIEKSCNPYVLCIKSDSENKINDFTMNIFGSKNFDLFRITKDGKGEKVQKFDKSIFNKIDKQTVEFSEVDFVEQPNKFHPNSKEISDNNHHISGDYIDEYSNYYYEYSSYYSREEEETNEENNFQNVNLNNNNNNSMVCQRNHRNNENENDNVIQYQTFANKFNNDSQIQGISHDFNDYNTQYSYNEEYFTEYEEEKVELNPKSPKSKKIYEEDKNEINNSDKQNPKNLCEEEKLNINNSEKRNINDSNNQDPQNSPNVKIDKTTENQINTNFNENATENKVEITSNNTQNINLSETERKMIDEAKIYLFKNNMNYFSLYIISKSRKKYIFALIDFGILILKQKLISRKMTKKYKILFDTITKISLLTNNMIEIQYNKKTKTKQLLIQTDDFTSLINDMINHIYRTLNQFEINKIVFENISLPQSLPKSTPHSISSRLNSKLSLKKIHILNEYLKLFSVALFSRSNSFFLAKVKKMQKLSPVLFPCISLDRDINEIDIVDPKFILPFLLKYNECFDNIKHLKIKGNDCKTIQETFNQFKNINSITFHDAQMKQIDFLFDIIKNRKIKSIGFESALNEKSFHFFVQNDTFSSLKYFRVSNLSKINFSECVNHFSNLHALSLTCCNLNIGNVFKILESNPIQNLEQFDLSGNISDNQDNLEYSIPISLNKLYINNAKWEIDQLKYFINTCSKSNLKSLSIDNIEFIDSIKSKDKWNIFFSSLPHSMKSICFLSWNSNEINEKFITFLINSNCLSEISFCSCKCSDLDEIKRLLIQSTNIRRANFQKIYSLNHAQFNNFLTAIPQMISLEQINLSHNNFNNDCFETLINSLIHSNLSFVAFDDSNIYSFSDLTELYDKLKVNRKMPINISYPILDIQRLKLNQDKIIILDKYLNKLKIPLENRVNSKIDQFQDVFYLKNDNFVQFLDDEKVNNTDQNNKKDSSILPSKPKLNILAKTNENSDPNKEIETNKNNEKAEIDKNDLSNGINDLDNDYSYEYYTVSEISEIEQSQSQINVLDKSNNHEGKTEINPNSINNIDKSINNDITKSFINNSTLNKWKKNDISHENPESTEYIIKNPYYKYVDDISNRNILHDNQDLSDDDLYSNMTHMQINESKIDKYKSNTSNDYKLFFLQLTSSEYDSSLINDNQNISSEIIESFD